jgi:uncharacterized protein (UPF0248 family)
MNPMKIIPKIIILPEENPEDMPEVVVAVLQEDLFKEEEVEEIDSIKHFFFLYNSINYL